MTLFLKDGHLTQEAFEALSEGSLCSRQRLQIAEHLSVCDRCLERLSAVTALELPAPSPCEKSVLQELHRARLHRVGLYLQRCGIVAAAACFAFMCWKYDLFGQMGTVLSKENAFHSAAVQFNTQMTQELNRWSIRLSEDLKDAVISKDPK